jgi:hypothetical protein
VHTPLCAATTHAVVCRMGAARPPGVRARTPAPPHAGVADDAVAIDRSTNGLVGGSTVTDTHDRRHCLWSDYCAREPARHRRVGSTEWAGRPVFEGNPDEFVHTAASQRLHRSRLSNRLSEINQMDSPGGAQMAAMSKEHKEAMARGRRQARAVRNYLDALERGKKRGPKLTEEKLERRIAKTRTDIDEETSPQKRLELIQQRMDDEALLEELQAQESLEDLEAAFVDVAADYSGRKGISYAAWRELDVPAKVLRAAGMSQSD